MKAQRLGSNGTRATPPQVRCAVYTRKSTEEGLEQEFNSLDAQREAGAAFILSQAGEGWSLLPDRYDDGGFTGGNMDRPALRRLMADIEAGQVDCVVVYKVDRLSRSLLDFARLMETFERHRISFVSVTQQFNTATSMGRLVLNVLLSFAQFEREIIAERTRDKIAATRRKGKWTGGRPLLGYDVDPRGGRLVVNADEAERVREIFRLYLAHEALLPVVQELERRGWRNKRWQTRKGHERGGQPFTKTSLHRLLTNVAYAGQVRYKDEVHCGEHPAIVDPAVFQRVQQALARNGATGGAAVRNQFGALLKGILRCTPCGSAMTPAHCKKGERRYRYYTCVSAQKRGWQTCPSKSIPAGEIEALVVEQLRCVGRDPTLRRVVLERARLQADEQMAALEAEGRTLDRDLARWHSDLHDLSCQLRPCDDNGPVLALLADLQERIGATEGRAQRVREQLGAVQQGLLDDDEAAAALSEFDPVWEMLTPGEQARVVGLLVERVDYDGGQGKLSITFHPTGIKALADELATQREEQIA
jgi:site-specific DNA recombinase